MKNTLKNTLKKGRSIDLGKDEIIVVSIVIGTLMAILLGYVFGETQYFYGTEGRVYYETDESYYAYNYTIGIASFIIFSGFIFLYLSRRKSNTEHREIVNAKVENVDELKVDFKVENPRHKQVVDTLTDVIQKSLDVAKQNGRTTKNYTFDSFIGNLINGHGVRKAELNFNLAKEAWNKVGNNPVTEAEAKAIYASYFGTKLPKDIFDSLAENVNEPKVEIKEENKDASKHIPSFEEGTMEDFLNL